MNINLKVSWQSNLKSYICNPILMPFNDFDNMPIAWADHEDVAMALYERFGDDFDESKIYRIRFTELLQWVLEIPHFEGKKEDSSEGHLEQIQAKWVYEWRANQK